MGKCPKINPTVDSACSHHIEQGFCKLPSKFRCPEYMKAKGIRLSYSSLQAYMKCKRAYYWTYIKGLELKEKAVPLVSGNLLHGSLQVLNESVYDEITTYDKLRELGIVETRRAADVKGSSDYLALHGLLSAYGEIVSKKAYKGIDYRVSGQAETPWEWQDEDRLISLYGYIDLLNTKDDYFVEYKYTARPETYTFFKMENQLSLYFLGTGVSKAIVRCFRKPYGTASKTMLCGELVEKVRKDVLHRPKYYIKDTVYYRAEYEGRIRDEIIPRIKIITREIRDKLDSDNLLAEFYQEQTELCTNCDCLPICETGGVPENMYERKGL